MQRKVLILPLNNSPVVQNLLGSLVRKLILEKQDLVYIPSSDYWLGNFMLKLTEDTPQQTIVAPYRDDYFFMHEESRLLRPDRERSYIIQLVDDCDVLVLVGNIDSMLNGKAGLAVRFARASNKPVQNLRESNSWSTEIPVEYREDKLVNHIDFRLEAVFEYMGRLITEADYWPLEDLCPVIGYMRFDYARDNTRKITYRIEDDEWYCMMPPNGRNPIITDRRRTLGFVEFNNNISEFISFAGKADGNVAQIS